MQSIEEFAKSWQGYCEGWEMLEQAVARYFKKRFWRKKTLRRLVTAHSRNKLAGAAYRVVEAEIIAYVKSTYNIEDT